MPWTKPAIREAMKKYLRVCRAREELNRCNVEIRRVLTSIHDEDRQFSGIIQRLKDRKSSILGPVVEYCTHPRRVNSLLLGHIQQTFNLNGFSGTKLIGRKKRGCIGAEGGLDSSACNLQTSDNDDLGGDDGEMNQVDGLLDFATNL